MTDTPTELTDLLGDLVPGGLFSALMRGLQQLDWAEEEIDRAAARHAAHADDLHHAFELLTPTAEVMSTEFVYRSHCRELLERVITGEDTRPATNAEVAAACSATSELAPFNTAGFLVYIRAFAAAFPDKTDILGDVVELESYEHVAGTEANRLESDLRRKLSVADRRLSNVSCSGWHHGEPVLACRYYAPEQLALPVGGG